MASSVAFLCLSDIDAVDSDRQAPSADRLSRQRQHALEHRDADRQITIEIKECGEKIGWLYGNKFGDGQVCRGLKAIQADWNAI
jgi:hypothetical protein